MWAIIDVANFYVSSERLFQPKLRDVPVIVLSNNDGCAIARSEEAKALHIKMGAPVFKIRDIIKRHGIELRSSNYELYADLNRRFNMVLADAMFVPGSIYTKCGVLLEGLTAETAMQADLFASADPKAGQLLTAMDGLNRRFGRATVRIASEGAGERSYDTKRSMKSPAYTTRIAEIPKVY